MANDDDKKAAEAAADEYIVELEPLPFDPGERGHYTNGFLAGIAHLRAQLTESAPKFDEAAFKKSLIQIVGQKMRYGQDGEAFTEEEHANGFGWFYDDRDAKIARKGAKWAHEQSRVREAALRAEIRSAAVAAEITALANYDKGWSELQDERDQLRAELNQASYERDRNAQERDRAEAERDRLKAEVKTAREYALAYQDQYYAKAKEFTAERAKCAKLQEELAEANQKYVNKRNQVMRFCERLDAERAKCAKLVAALEHYAKLEDWPMLPVIAREALAAHRGER